MLLFCSISAITRAIEEFTGIESNLKPLGTPRTGDYCLAADAPDLFRRAKIASVAPEYVTVFLLDFGGEVGFKREELFHIPDQLLRSTPFCVGSLPFCVAILAQTFPFCCRPLKESLPV